MLLAGYVNAEGGPLLIVDGGLAAEWRGTNENDYERACALFDRESIEGSEIAVGPGVGVVWEMRGAGTAYVYCAPSGSVVVVRGWLDDPDDQESIKRLADPPISKAVELGEIDVPTGVLAILWAAESGDCIESLNIHGAAARPTGEMAIESAGLLVKVAPARLLVVHDSVTYGRSTARRCHIRPVMSPT